MKRKNNNKLILSLFLILIFISLYFFQEKIKETVYFISSPFQRIFWVSGREIYSIFEKKQELENLRRENSLLLQQISVANIYKIENNELRRALEIGINRDFELIFSKTIGKKLSEDILIIDKGEKNGVFEKMPVITAEKVLLGKITKTYDYFSEVSLITRKDFIFDIIIGEGIFAIAKGEGNSKMRIDFISPEKIPETGDIVLTSGKGGIFQEGLLVGKIEDIKKQDTDFYYYANVDPIFSFTRADNLFIINMPLYDF